MEDGDNENVEVLRFNHMTQGSMKLACIAAPRKDMYLAYMENLQLLTNKLQSMTLNAEADVIEDVGTTVTNNANDPDYVPIVFDNFSANVVVNESTLNLGLWDTTGYYHGFRVLCSGIWWSSALYRLGGDSVPPRRSWRCCSSVAAVGEINGDSGGCGGDRLGDGGLGLCWICFSWEPSGDDWMRMRSTATTVVEIGDGWADNVDGGC
ncbi:hypothetical protein Dimus_004043 [Dionaea muscipula]